MRNGKQIQGMSVVSIENGKKLGTADELIVSPDELRLVGFVLKSGGMLNQRELIVETDDVRSFGPDAITVDAEDAARVTDAAQAALLDARGSDRRITGNKVVTASGRMLGTVSDYVFDEPSGRITSLLLGGSVLTSTDAVSADLVISVGPDAIVVRDDGEVPSNR